MRRRRVLVVVAGAAVVWGAGLVGVPGAAGVCRSRLRVVRLAGQLRGGRRLPGPAPSPARVRGPREGRRLGQGDRATRLEFLNRGGNATVNSVSCASPSSCTAGGSYTDRSRFSRFQGFVT
jgi:hypothetical protein